MKRTILGCAGLILLVSALACSAGSAAPATTPNTTAQPAATASPVLIVSSRTEFLLKWEGFTNSGCGELTVTRSYGLLEGACEHATARIEVIQQEDSLLFLKAMATELSSFDTAQDKDSLSFQGTGAGTSPAWRRALHTWAVTTFAQDTTGHVCAACQTALSWSLGKSPDQPEVCRHLTVLSFGVAYAETGPCDGSAWTLAKRAVISTARWESFDGWMTLYQPYNDHANNFNATGSQQLNGAAIAQVDGWAQAVHSELAARK